MHPLLGSWNGTQASSLGGAANNFIAYGSFVWTWIAAHWELFISWLEQPHILAIILAWWVTFTVIITVLLTFGGFGHGGIIAGSLAAGFQSWMYGGFTPAAGIFATLTSVGMLGYVVPVYVAASVAVATFVAGLVWASGAGT